MINKKNEITLGDIFGIFLPKLWLIIVASIVFGAAAGSYAMFLKDDTYTSTTKIHVVKSSTNSGNISSGDLSLVESALDNYVDALKSPDVANLVKDDIVNGAEYKATYDSGKWGDLSASQISGYVSLSATGERLVISVTSPDPELSCAIAKSMASVVETENILAYPDAMISIKVYQQATLGTKNSHKVVTTTLIGILAGAFLAAAVIFIINLKDVTIRDKKRIEDNFDIPVLGVIPRFIEE